MGARNVALRIRSGGLLMAAAVMALCVAVFLPASSAPAQQMTLPGKASVDPNGGAGYGIPISVPPGTAGLAPSLSFQYNNQSGNGLLGMGWSLGGLAAVGRCPQTIAQDNWMGRVNYDANDRFCLDGQRLVPINGGAYGADGTEYRTEIESFSRVISHGNAGTGPAWFEVHTKSGQIMEFGHTADSQALAQGSATARSWAVNKVSDTKGNYFTVTYTVDAPNGQVYPARIDYTGNAGAGLQPYNSVQFFYAARPDVTALWHAGSLMQTTQRLTDVKTYAGANLVADYQLTYSTSITNLSVLASISLCAGDGSCLPATAFTVTNSGTFIGPASFQTLPGNTVQRDGTTVVASGLWGGGTFIYPNGWNFGTPPTANYVPFTGDFDGDGKTDFAFAMATSIYVMRSNGDGTFTANNFTYPNSLNFGAPPWANYLPFSGDFNGDGKMDFAFAGATAIYVMLGNGDGTFSETTFSYPSGWNLGSPPTTSWTPIIGDFNADGRTDIAFASSATVDVLLSNGDGTFAASSFAYPNSWNFGGVAGPGGGNGGDGTANPSANYAPVIGDFDGDGKTDFAFAGSTSISILRSNGDGTFSGSAFTYPNGWNFGNPSQGASYSAPVVGDFNGDGKTDLIFARGSNSDASIVGTGGVGTNYVLLGKGDGTFAGSSFPTPSEWNFSSQYSPVVGDFNGDGKTDLVFVMATVSYFMLGNGDGSFSMSQFTYPNSWNFGAPPSANYAPIAGDFNGDGKVDFAFAGATTLYMLQATSSPPNYLLSTATSGLGAVTTFTYQPLTNGSVYIRGSGATWPITDVQAPIYVVSRVDNSNGLGGTLSASYAYAGGRVDRTGRGFLGFRQVTATDLQTNIAKITTYRQDYPLTALVGSETQALGGATLSATHNVYTSTWLDSTHYQVSLIQSQSSSTDLDGSALPTVTTSYQYDAYGNATQVAVAATDGHSKVTTNTYTNDTTNWLLGRLTTASVTSTLSQPGAAPALQPTFTIVPIYGNTQNFNLWNYMVANNLATPGAPASVWVSVNGGVISSSSTAAPAFDTGVFPSGSWVGLGNWGTIVGAGGNEGAGGSCSAPAASGGPGGPALRAQFPLTLQNNTSIRGGGGGGGGGAGGSVSVSFFGSGVVATLAGGSGGGGAGVIGGGAVVGGAGLNGGGSGGPLGGTNQGGNPGTMTAGGAGTAGQALTSSGGFGGSINLFAGSGGNGGGPGLAGSTGGSAGGNGGGFYTISNCSSPGAGGAAGPAVIGNSVVTWTTTGDVRGPLN